MNCLSPLVVFLGRLQLLPADHGHDAGDGELKNWLGGGCKDGLVNEVQSEADAAEDQDEREGAGLLSVQHGSSLRAVNAGAQEDVSVFEQDLGRDAALDPVVDPLRTAPLAVPELLGDLDRST